MSGRFLAGSSSTSRQFVMAAATALAVGLSYAALAFACSPQATISVTPTSVQPGDRVTVSGIAFAGAVQVRWNGASGPLLASVSPEGQSFVTTVTIPDVAPNAYVIIATARDASGGFLGQSSAAVEVSARPAAAAPASSGQAAAPAGQSGAADTSAAPATSQPAEATGAPAASKPATSKPTAASKPAASKPAEGAAAPVRSATHGNGARRPAAAQSRDRTPATAPRQSAERQTPALTTTARRGDQGSAPARATAPRRQTEHAAVTAPAQARRPAAPARAVPPPSLVSPVDPSALHAGRSDSRLAIGLGMLGFSLIALLGSFGVAEVRRRRVTVRRTNS